jgi:hypothetical protein
MVADRDKLLAWARMIVSMLDEAELWDDVYITIAAHLTLREIFDALIERALISEEEAKELGIHPDDVAPSLSVVPTRNGRSNVVPLRLA